MLKECWRSLEKMLELFMAYKIELVSRRDAIAADDS
jgi:hypothetical protein